VIKTFFIVIGFIASIFFFNFCGTLSSDPGIFY
jgi:hypothetical protein